jgi:hypothetical protein
MQTLKESQVRPHLLRMHEVERERHEAEKQTLRGATDRKDGKDEWKYGWIDGDCLARR